MALMATTSLAVDGRGEIAMAGYQAIVDAIIAGKAQDAYNCLRDHISVAYVTRLKQELRDE